MNSRVASLIGMLYRSVGTTERERMDYQIACGIGGTFTDIVVLDEH